MSNGESRTVVLSLDALPLFGQQLAQALLHAALPSLWVSLEGPLGAGKTTLMRALLSALGVTDSIKSPTYTLVETYHRESQLIQHWDWYRLQDASELEVLGFEESLVQSWTFVEWASRFESLSERSDLWVEWVRVGEPRHVRLRASSTVGEAVIHHLQWSEHAGDERG